MGLKLQVEIKESIEELEKAVKHADSASSFIASTNAKLG